METKTLKCWDGEAVYPVEVLQRAVKAGDAVRQVSGLVAPPVDWYETTLGREAFAKLYGPPVDRAALEPTAPVGAPPDLDETPPWEDLPVERGDPYMPVLEDIRSRLERIEQQTSWLDRLRRVFQ